MTIHVILTAIIFFLYLVARAPFRRLTLHYDTGFYVSNHTVSANRVRFSKGWNARYAGCSKVIPELILGRAYFVARKKTQHCKMAVGEMYARTFRFRLSIIGFLAAILVGLLAYQIGSHQIGFYYAGLIAFCLISSEPQWGNFHECAEVFELLPQVCSIVLLLVGIDIQSGALVGSAAFLWLAEAYFIKLSSIVSFVCLFSIVSVLHADYLLDVVWGASAATILYLVWCRVNGHSFTGMLAALSGHETAFHRRGSLRTMAHRVGEKVRCLARVVVRQPIVPLFALLGLLVNGYQHTLLMVCLFALLASYVAQATDCRYYLIPLQPPVAVLAGIGVCWLWNTGLIGGFLVVGCLAAWILNNTIRAIGLDGFALDQWCWRGFRPTHEIERNQLLVRESPSIANLVQDRSMIVYGPLTQAYVLVGASYDVPLITPDHHLDDMHREWQVELNRKLIQDPPAFVLDTDKCFAAKTMRESLGLDYRLVWGAGSSLLLYEIKVRNEASELCGSALTYCAQSEAQLTDERRLGTDGAANAALDQARSSPRADVLSDEAELRLRVLLDEIRSKGHQRLAVFGAGRFTKRHADVYRSSPLSVDLVLDDDAMRFGERFLDWPIRRPGDVAPTDLDAVIISTDRFAGPMMRRAREEWRGSVAVYTLE